MLLALATAATSRGQDPNPDEWWIEDFYPGSVSLALPSFDSSPGTPRETANELTRILFDDIAFTSRFRMIERERYPRARRANEFDAVAWESVGADLVITGTVSETSGQRTARVQLRDVRRKGAAFDTEYRSSAPLREFAHYVSDRILERFGITGAASTRIFFASTRFEGHKAIYEMDYDGANVRQLTRYRHLDFLPRLAPDHRTLSFISYRVKNDPPVLAILNGEPIYSGPGMVFSSDWSPDGSHVAFAASRDEPGNAEIYVARRDGSGVRRLTHHPSTDIAPTWSPTGRELAFTSDRTGSPQVYVMDAEGLNLRRISMKGSYNAEPAWSPSRDHTEIAYSSRVRGGDFDIVVHDLAANRIRVLTSGPGMNESVGWAPNGLHLVFSSTRAGAPQIYIVNSDGSQLRRITDEGENVTPSWGPLPSR